MSKHQPKRYVPSTRVALLFGLCAGLLPIGRTTAQGPDTAREIQELAKRIDDQLKEIDRLLLESAKKDQVRSKPKELLQQSVDRSKDVETGIEELIEKLQEMKNQSSSSSSQSDDPSQCQDQNQPKDQQDQKPGEGQKPGQQRRRDSQTPDFVRQPQQGEGEQKPGEGQPKPGEQPNPQTGKDCEKPGQGDPKGGKGDKTPGQNLAGKAPPDGATGPGNPGQGSESWGELQGYLNELKNRGSAPKVPEKYRKYWEAYLKQKQSAGSGGTGGGK